MDSYEQGVNLDRGEKEYTIAGKCAWNNIIACSKGATDSQGG
jgi:hypothetical protein